MVQTSFKTTDYGEMTLAKLGPEGTEFLLASVEETDGQWGKFVVLLGSQNGEPYEIRAGGRAGKLFLQEKKKMIGKVVSIIPSGAGMQRVYEVSVK